MMPADVDAPGRREDSGDTAAHLSECPAALTAVSEPLLELQRASRHYLAGRVQAVRDVSLAVVPGEFLAVVGPSGSGKTTLLNLMCGLDRPTSGTVRFGGRAPGHPQAWARLRAAHVGFVFQACHLLPALTAAENVQVPMLGVEPDARRRSQRARELIEWVGLSARGEHRPDQLSGGEKQRVAIARGLANAPRLVLADEPTGNLDSANAAAVAELLVRLVRVRGVTLVLVTHNRELVRDADRVIEFVDGQVTGVHAGRAR